MLPNRQFTLWRRGTSSEDNVLLRKGVQMHPTGSSVLPPHCECAHQLCTLSSHSPAQNCLGPLAAYQTFKHSFSHVHFLALPNTPRASAYTSAPRRIRAALRSSLWLYRERTQKVSSCLAEALIRACPPPRLRL